MLTLRQASEEWFDWSQTELNQTMRFIHKIQTLLQLGNATKGTIYLPIPYYVGRELIFDYIGYIQSWVFQKANIELVDNKIVAKFG